jgi:hypothetical protein
MSTKCDKGYKDGTCCCNCKYLVPLMKHPKNKEIGIGSVKEQMGYVCLGPTLASFADLAVFFDHKHGMCELYKSK